MRLIIKNSAFRSLFLCGIFNTTGSNLFALAFLIYASTYPNSKFYISLVALFMVIPTFFNAYMGYLADRTKDKKRGLFMTSWIQTILFIGVAFAIEQRSFFVFLFCILVNLVDELLAMYKDGLELPIMQSRVSSDDIQPAYGLIQGASSLNGIVGKPIGLALLAILGNSFSMLALVNAGLYFISGIVLFESRKYLYIEVTKKPDGGKFHFSLKETLLQIIKVFKVEGTTSAISLIIIILIINFSINGILPLIDLAMVHHNPFGHNFGLAVTVFSLSFSLGVFISSFFMHDFFQKKNLSFILKLVLGLLILFSLFLMSFGLVSIALFFAIGYCFAKVNPKLTSIIFQIIPKEDLATIRGGISTFFATASSMGVLVFVALANLIGLSLTFYIIAFICFIALISPTFINLFKKNH